jgi:hypothetical protein
MTKKKTPPVASSEDAAAATAAAAADVPEPADTDKPSSPSSADYTVAFSPRQVAVGLAIVAGLVAIAFRHRRSRDRKPADD